MCFCLLTKLLFSEKVNPTKVTQRRDYLMVVMVVSLPPSLSLILPLLKCKVAILGFEREATSQPCCCLPAGMIVSIGVYI